MNVSPINTNPTSFNGYVDKSFKVFVKEAVNQEIRAMLASANNTPNVVQLDKFDFARIQKRGEALIEKLETQFMKKLHPQTSLSVRNIGAHYEAYLSNECLGENVLIPINNKPRIPSLTSAKMTKENKILTFADPLEMYSKKSKGSLLGCFERFVDQLLGLDPQKVDDTLLKLFSERIINLTQKTEFVPFRKLQAKLAGMLANKYAKKIGRTANYNEIFETALKNRKIANENNKLAKDFMEEIKL